jgi:hypothetical protein
MFTITRMQRGALAVLLVAMSAAVADAQKPTPGPRRSRYCASGLFTLVAGHVKFHVSLDDRALQPATLVVLRLIDDEGTVVKTRNAVLEPGQSTTLDYSAVGLFRVQAEAFETTAATTRLSDRRRVVGMVELFDDFRAVIPVECAEPIPQGRIPG